MWTRLRWHLLLATHVRCARAWRAALSGPLREAAHAHPALQLKPLRPYMDRRWGCARRMKVIGDTHRLARSHPLLHRALATPSGVRMAHGALNAGAAYEVRLGPNRLFASQGELALTLRDSWQGPPLLALSLSFEEDAGGAIRCCLGAMRGRRDSAAALAAVSDACRGLHPALLLWHIVSELAHCVGATQLLGAAHAVHVPACDRTWQELGGWLDADGWYRLPLDAAPPASMAR